jgi:hypothetical protein
VSTFATVTVVDSKGPSKLSDVAKIEAALARDPRTGIFKVERVEPEPRYAVPLAVVDPQDAEPMDEAQRLALMAPTVEETFPVPPRTGRLVISIDVKATSLYQAGAIGLLCVEKALRAVGFNRAELVVESSVIPVAQSVGFRRPKGLRQLGYDAAA